MPCDNQRPFARFLRAGAFAPISPRRGRAFGRYTMNETKDTQGTRTEEKREGQKWELVTVEVDEETARRTTLLARQAGVSKSAFLRDLLLREGAKVADVEAARMQAAPPGTVKMKTLVALVRVPERVAQGLRYGSGSLALWCGEWLAAAWDGDFDGEEWEEEVRARFGCEPADKLDFDGLDAGFVEAGSEAEKTIMGLLTERADADTSAE